MKAPTVEIDRFGRIVVPKATRDELGLGAGTRLELRAEGGEIRLRPLPETPNLARRGELLVATGKLVGDVRDAVEIERDERYRAVAGRALGRRR